MINPIMIDFQRNSNEKKCHPKNDWCIFANMDFAIPKTLLGDSNPDFTEATKHLPKLQGLNKDLLDWRFVTVEHVHKIMTFFWRAIVNKFESNAIE